jgi:hypothetical protein
MPFVALECSPSNLVHTRSCLSCLSQHELLAVIALSLAKASGTYAENVPALLKDSACYACLSEKELLQASAALVSNMAYPDNTVPEIVALAKCLVCANPRQLKAAILFMLCNSFQVEV